MIKHTSKIGDRFQAITDLKRSLWCAEKHEWGLSAETVLNDGTDSDLGVINGSIGVESIFSQNGTPLHRHIAMQKRQNSPTRSLFTGATLGKSGISLNDIEENPHKVTDIMSTEWNCIGAFNGISSLFATEKLSADLGIIADKQAVSVIRIIEECIMHYVGEVDDIESDTLFSFENGVTGIVAFGNSRFTSSMFAEWSVQCIDEMLSRLEYVDEGAFVSDGTRLLPYVANGTAGVLLAMLSLPTGIWPPHWGDIVQKLLSAIAPRFTLNAGFGEGASGLIFTAARCRNMLGCEIPYATLDELVDDILGTRIYDVVGPGNQQMYHIMSEGQMAVSRDLWSGTAGTYIALEEYLSRGKDATGQHDLLRNILKY